jgi:hypothetical protein
MKVTPSPVVTVRVTVLVSVLVTVIAGWVTVLVTFTCCVGPRNASRRGAVAGLLRDHDTGPGRGVVHGLGAGARRRHRSRG